MAISIAYGLGVATFNTLILLPTLLKLTNDGSKWLYWLWEGEHEEDEFFEPAIQEQLSIKHNSE
jgi:predicted RND superfamily exporter protein